MSLTARRLEYSATQCTSGARRDGNQMATPYNLQSNEVVLIKDESVMHEGSSMRFRGELILTNLNLLFIQKSAFGKTQGALFFPLNQIKVYNDQAQAMIGKARNSANALEVYFLQGVEKFVFLSGGKKKLSEWASKINVAVTGEYAPIQTSASRALPGAELVAGVLKDTFSVFKTKFGAAPQAPVKVAGKCRSCGASATGFQGQTITCEYCGAAQQL